MIMEKLKTGKTKSKNLIQINLHIVHFTTIN